MAETIAETKDNSAGVMGLIGVWAQMANLSAVVVGAIILLQLIFVAMPAQQQIFREELRLQRDHEAHNNEALARAIADLAVEVRAIKSIRQEERRP